MSGFKCHISHRLTQSVSDTGQVISLGFLYPYIWKSMHYTVCIAKCISSLVLSRRWCLLLCIMFKNSLKMLLTGGRNNRKSRNSSGQSQLSALSSDIQPKHDWKLVFICLCEYVCEKSFIEEWELFINFILVVNVSAVFPGW